MEINNGHCTVTFGAVKALLNKACGSAPRRLLEPEKVKPKLEIKGWPGRSVGLLSVEYSVSEEVKTDLGIQKASVSYGVSSDKVLTLCLVAATAKIPVPDGAVAEYEVDNLEFPVSVPVEDADLFFSFDLVKKKE